MTLRGASSSCASEPVRSVCGSANQRQPGVGRVRATRARCRPLAALASLLRHAPTTGTAGGDERSSAKRSFSSTQLSCDGCVDRADSRQNRSAPEAKTRAAKAPPSVPASELAIPSTATPRGDKVRASRSVERTKVHRRRCAQVLDAELALVKRRSGPAATSLRPHGQGGIAASPRRSARTNPVRPQAAT